jgi:tellurite resistance protein TehA-like permease
MVAIGVWRHGVRRLPLRYHPGYWAMVFPLGMYGAATFRMRAAIELDDLEWLPQLVLGVALLAWATTMAGLVHQGIRAVRRPSASGAS